MKTRNLCMVLLAGLLAMPMGVNAKKGMGWLHLGEGNDSYYDESATTVPVKYEGTTYQAYPVIGEKGVYYVPNEKTFGTKNENLKILFLENAKLEKNIRCTKSTTNLAVVVSGQDNKITYGKGSCFKIETGNLYIVGLSGNPVNDQLRVIETGSYHGMYTSNGSITIKNISLHVTTYKDKATISQELASGKLYITNSSIETNHRIYAKGGVKLTDASYADEGATVKNKYIVNSKGKIIESVSIKAKYAIVKKFIHLEGFTVAYSSGGEAEQCGDAADCYRLPVDRNVVTKGDIYVFTASGGSVSKVILLDNVVMDKRYGIELKSGNAGPIIMVSGNCSIGHILADPDYRGQLDLTWGKLITYKSGNHNYEWYNTTKDKKSCTTATLTLTGTDPYAGGIDLCDHTKRKGKTPAATLVVYGLNLKSAGSSANFIKGCKTVVLEYSTISGGYVSPVQAHSLRMKSCGVPTSYVDQHSNFYFSTTDETFNNARNMPIERTGSFYEFDSNLRNNKITIR